MSFSVSAEHSSASTAWISCSRNTVGIQRSYIENKEGGPCHAVKMEMSPRPGIMHMKDDNINVQEMKSPVRWNHLRRGQKHDA